MPAMAALFHIVECEEMDVPQHASPPLSDFLRQCFYKNASMRPSARDLSSHVWLMKDEETSGQTVGVGLPRSTSLEMLVRGIYSDDQASVKTNTSVHELERAWSRFEQHASEDDRIHALHDVMAMLDSEPSLIGQITAELPMMPALKLLLPSSTKELQVIWMQFILKVRSV
jgi:hypothetical protein